MTTESNKEAKTEDKDEDKDEDADVEHIQDKSQYADQFDENEHVYLESPLLLLPEQQFNVESQTPNQKSQNKKRKTRKILSKSECKNKWAKQVKERWKLSQGSWRVFIINFITYFKENGQQKYISRYKDKQGEQTLRTKWQLMKKRVQSTVNNRKRRKGGSNPSANNHNDLYSLLVYTTQSHQLETQFMMAICRQYLSTAFEAYYNERIAKKQQKRRRQRETMDEKIDGSELEQQDNELSMMTQKIGIFLNTIQKQQSKSMGQDNNKFTIQQVLDL